MTEIFLRELGAIVVKEEFQDICSIIESSTENIPISITPVLISITDGNKENAYGNEEKILRNYIIKFKEYIELDNNQNNNQNN